MNVFDALWSRLVSSGSAVAFDTTGLLVAVGLGLLGALWRPAWQVLKLITTLVHELGHAFVAMMFARRFTGLVIRSDMSGHAVTVGPPKGLGSIATAWAGYPAPAVIAAVAAIAAANGYAAAALGFFLLCCVVALTRAKSLFTAFFLGAVTAGLAAVWWWRDDGFQAQLLICLSVLLVFGAWRHLGIVARSGGSGSDVSALRDLTSVPSGFWLASFFVVIALSSAVTVMSITTHL